MNSYGFSHPVGPAVDYCKSGAFTIFFPHSSGSGRLSLDIDESGQVKGRFEFTTITGRVTNGSCELNGTRLAFEVEYRDQNGKFLFSQSYRGAFIPPSGHLGGTFTQSGFPNNRWDWHWDNR